MLWGYLSNCNVGREYNYKTVAKMILQHNKNKVLVLFPALKRL